jgi:hypothetical protein
MDSGDDEDEVVDWASDGRLPQNWYASKPFLAVGFHWSTHDRAKDAFCACAIAEHIDGRLDPKANTLAAGVTETAD